MKVTIQYFAVLREQAGCGSESWETSVSTPGALFEELRARHRFSLPQAALKVAVNDEFSSWDAALREGDRVVFIPPVAGG